MQTHKMTGLEKRAVISLSSIMAFRMAGLFMVVPLLTLYAHQLTSATPALIGLAIGIYGLSQALCQVPFGALSDRFGRKNIITVGLLLFALGSFLCGVTHSIYVLILGRILQGAGAVGSTILAMIADLTREEQRTKSMAIVGITIGFSFAVAMVTGPLLARFLAVNQLFYVAFSMSFVSIVLLYFVTPTPMHIKQAPPLRFAILWQLFKDRRLMTLNSGIFLLHTIFTASFVIIPIQLLKAGLKTETQWKLYLPILCAAFLISLIGIGFAERKQQTKPYFLAAILMLWCAEFLLWRTNDYFSLSLLLFFTGFSLLEAFLPSLMSKTAPPEYKGSAMGLFSSSQFLGIFAGGLLGGWFYGQFGYSGVYLFCLLLTFIWLCIAFFMHSPRYLVTQLLKLPSHPETSWQMIAEQLHAIPGVLDVTYVAEESVIYLKMEQAAMQHPDFICLKEQLQSH